MRSGAAAMRPGYLSRLTLSVVVATLLAGCGGSELPIGTPRAMSQSNAIAAHADRDGSWMLPEAKNEDLLYVTNYSYVSVYSYPALKLVGVLKGFYSTVGACVDAKENVFITNHVYSSRSTRIAEYEHGGKQPIAELATNRIGPIGCSIDPATGNLAVSGGGSSRGVGADVFKDARGKPTFVKTAGIVFAQFCAYDATGNLFVDGESDFSGTPALDEMPTGASKFEPIKLNATISDQGGIQWDGKHIAIGAYQHKSGSQYVPVIYRFAIDGAEGKKVGATELGSPAGIVLQFYILHGTIVVPNWYFQSTDNERKDVLLYRYPQGGSPVNTLEKDTPDARGVVVSLAPK